MTLEKTSIKNYALLSRPDDTEFVKVSSPTHGSEGLLESDDDWSNVVTVPSGAEQNVAKPVKIDKQVNDWIMDFIQTNVAQWF